MTVLYVREQGAVVRRMAEELRVTLDERVLARTPVREVEQVVLLGNVQLTTQAAALLLQQEVDIVFLSYSGGFRGRLGKDGSRFARLRHAQLQISGDEHRSLALALSLVRAKLANQRELLQELAGRVDGAGQDGRRRMAFALAAQRIDAMRRAAGSATTPDMLRGYEGKAAAFYFEALGTLLDPSWSFQGRKYYPPPDPFNAALSFGYALLQKDISAAIQLVGLDPYLGCFHALEYGRPSLVLDLMEEFRPAVVDWTVLDLVLSGKMRPRDFTFTGQQARPVELGPTLMPVLVNAYEARAGSQTAHAASGTHTSFRRCFELQARIFARVVLGGRAEYGGATPILPELPDGRPGRADEPDL